MSTTSQDSVTPAPAPLLFQSVLALPNRIFDAIDLASLLLAMKSSLAIVLTIGIAFWFGNISAGIGATTALMIQKGFSASTIQTGIMRFVGGITGWLAALVLLALFSQDRVLFIVAISLAVGVVVFFMQGSRFFYAYLLGAVSMVLIGYGSVENPDGSFEFGVAWGSGILLAVVVDSLVHSLLWPTDTATIFEEQLRANSENGRDLLRLMVETSVEGKDRRADLIRIEQSLIQGLSKPAATLQTAAIDSWRMKRFEVSYKLLLDKFTSLAHAMVGVREHLDICQSMPVFSDFVHQSATLQQITQKLNDQMQNFVEAHTAPRDGSRLGEMVQARESFDPLVHKLADEIASSEADGMSKGALLGLQEKLAQLATQITTAHQSLASVETGKARTEARAVVKHQSSAPPFAPRLIKSAIAVAVMIAVACLWILTNWPSGTGKLMIYTVVVVSFNALFPAMPRRGILLSLLIGPVVAAVLYFALMRPLDGYFQLAVVFFFATLPFCYLINSANVTKMFVGKFGGMLVCGLTSISLQQSYSFSTFSNALIGDCGGFIVPMLLLQFFAWSTPEQTLRRNVLGFFQNCGQTLGALGASPSWTEPGKSLLAARQAGLLKSFKACSLSTHFIDPQRAPQNDSKKVSQLLASMQSLMFRIDLTEHARLPAPDDAAYARLSAAVHELRKSFEDALEAIQNRIRGLDPGGVLPDTRARIEEYRHQLDALGDHPAVDAAGRATAGRVLVLAGYYRALAAAIDQCHEDVSALDWQQWEQTYI
ncbi:MAG: FUSC family protein [Pseudomonas sp.]|uniref:FUSC family protein n=1 Tax=Pseudomonas sp. TaxID=306 RepID=UPI003C74D74F